MRPHSARRRSWPPRQRRRATTLGSRSAAADRLSIIAAQCPPRCSRRLFACTRLPLSQVLLVPGRARLFTTATRGHCVRLTRFAPSRRPDRYLESRTCGRWQAGDRAAFVRIPSKVIEPTLFSRARRLPGWPIRTCTASHDFGSDRNSGHAVDIAETTWMILSRHGVRYSQVRSKCQGRRSCSAAGGRAERELSPWRPDEGRFRTEKAQLGDWARSDIREGGQSSSFCMGLMFILTTPN